MLVLGNMLALNIHFNNETVNQKFFKIGKRFIAIYSQFDNKTAKIAGIKWASSLLP